MFKRNIKMPEPGDRKKMSNEFDYEELGLIIVTDNETADSKVDDLGEYVFKDQDNAAAIYGATCRVVFAHDLSAAQRELEENGDYTFTFEPHELDLYNLNCQKIEPYTSQNALHREWELANLWEAFCEDTVQRRHDDALRLASKAKSASDVVIALNDFDNQGNLDLKITIDDVMELPWCIQHSCFDDDTGPMGAIHPDGHAIMEGDGLNNYRWCFWDLDEFFRFHINSEASQDEEDKQVQVWMDEFHETRKNQIAE
jgi:hypothetical protein